MAKTTEQLIGFLNKFGKTSEWDPKQQNKSRYGDYIVSAPIYNTEEADKAAQELRDRLGEKVFVEVRYSPNGYYRIFVDEAQLTKEMEQRERKLQAHKEELDSKRVGLEARVHPIFDRGGKAEGLLKREQYMLTQKQVNFVRQQQLAAVFNSERSQKVGEQLAGGGEPDPSKLQGPTSKATGMILSHETHPAIFKKDDPSILIGDNGEAIMLSSKAAFDQGGMGMVYIGQRLDTGDFCVVKSLFQVNKESRIEFESENTQLDDLNLLIDKMNTMHGGEEKLYSVQELAWGKNYCKKLDVETEGQNNHDFLLRMDMFIEAIKAFEHLHKVEKKFHKDIKVENIMWDDKTRQAKLVDMGAMKSIGVDGTVVDHFFGTPAYLAPELVNSRRDQCIYNIQTEVYAIGMLACEMFSSDNLSLGASQVYQNFKYGKAGLSQLLSEADIFKPDKNRTAAEQELFDLLRKMVDMDKNKRPVLSEVLEKCLSIKQRIELERKVGLTPVMPALPPLLPLPPALPKQTEPKPQVIMGQKPPPVSWVSAKPSEKVPDETLKDVRELRDSMKMLVDARKHITEVKQKRGMFTMASSMAQDSKLQNLYKEVDGLCNKDRVIKADLEKLTQLLIDAYIENYPQHLKHEKEHLPISGAERVLKETSKVVQQMIVSTEAYKKEIESRQLVRRELKREPEQPSTIKVN